MLCASRSPRPLEEMPIPLDDTPPGLLARPEVPAADGELMARLAGGNSEALRELYDRHASLLLALALRILHNRDDAEEVVQEAFLYAWRKACSYDPARSSVSSWLVVIVRSRSLDRLRSFQRLESMRLELERCGAEHRHLFSEGFGQVLDDERAARVRRALAHLPPSQRQVLEFSYYDGRTQKEVAEMTGVPLGTVKTRTFLAIRKLRRELAKEAGSLM